MAIGAFGFAALVSHFVHQSASSPQSAGDVNAGSPARNVDSCGGAGERELETSLEVGTSSSDGAFPVVVAVENNTADELSMAHVAQLLDAQEVDVLEPIVIPTSRANAKALTHSPAVRIGLRKVPDGYYQLLVHTEALRSTNDPEAARSTFSSAQSFLAVESGSIRRIEFDEWYRKSGADRLIVTDAAKTEADAP